MSQDHYTHTLTRRGLAGHLTPHVPKLDQLFFTGRKTLIEVRGELKVVDVKEFLHWHYSDDFDSCTQFYLGLLPLVRQYLAFHRIAYQDHVGPLQALPAPDENRLACLRDFDEPVLTFMQAHERGLIRYDPAGKVSLPFLLTQIGYAWPDQRIVIVASRREKARRLVRQLRDNGLKIGLVDYERRRERDTHAAFSDYVGPEARDGIVGIPSTLADGCVTLEQRRLYLSVDPLHLFGGTYQSTALGLARACQARIFGLLPTSARLSPRLRDWLLALFGDAEVVVGSHGSRTLPVRVAFVKCEGGPKLDHDLAGEDLKRQGIDSNQMRLRRLCAVVKALAAGDHAALTSKCEHIVPALPSEVRSIAVLTETIEQGLVLARKLNASLVAAKMRNEVGLSEDDLKILKASAFPTAGQVRVVVATHSGVGRVGKVDVLVRADGGTGSIAGIINLLTTPSQQPDHLLVVDVQDRTHPTLRRHSRQRREAYRKQGWLIQGEEEQTLMDRFLSTRPEEAY